MEKTQRPFSKYLNFCSTEKRKSYMFGNYMMKEFPFWVNCPFNIKSVTYCAPFVLGSVYTLVLLICLVWTKKENDTFVPGTLSVHTGIFDSEPKDTEPKGIVVRPQPDWSCWMTYISWRNLPNTPNNRCVRLKALIVVCVHMILFLPPANSRRAHKRPHCSTFALCSFCFGYTTRSASSDHVT